jgi:hypothetical protein
MDAKESSSTEPMTTPYRQIRALYDEQTITIYQAYSETIAKAAVAAQKLNVSPSFKLTRMTWIKPSWAWVCYRAGYSYKDSRQARILALTMKHENFLELLRRAQLSHGLEEGTKDGTAVRVQWDPERTPALEKLPYRSIQIGIPADLSKTWVEEWIVEIEDVTEKARGLKVFLDEHPDADLDSLVAEGLVPEERVYDVPEDVQKVLAMNRQ